MAHIEVSAHSVTHVGKEAVDLFRLRMIRTGLKGEALGLKMARGVSCTKLAQGITGLKTRDREALAAALTKIINEASAAVPVVHS